MKIIVSPAIYIRLLTPHDYAELYRLIEKNRDYLKQWLPWIDLVKNEEQALLFIKTAIYRHNQLEASNYAIFYHKDLVGLAGFNSFDFTNHFATLGYWLDQAHNGKGIVSQVVSKLLDFGFNDLALHKVEIRCAVENLKSRAIPERLGFIHEGQFRQCEWLYDHYVDHAVYSILVKEYTKGKLLSQ